MITSLKNPLVRQALRLRESRRERQRTGLFLVEGLREIRRALAGGFSPRTVLHSPALLDENGRKLVHDLPPGVALAVAPPVINRLLVREDHDGLCALFAPAESPLPEPPSDHAAFYLVLEGVEKPGNLGALLRSADGAGADAVFLCGSATDPWNPNVIRASLGTVFSLPVIRMELADLRAWLMERQVRCLGASPAARRSFYEADLRGPLALFLGSEADGLTPEALAAVDEQLSLPMAGQGDSLNVSAAGAVQMYEVVRQRRGI